MIRTSSTFFNCTIRKEKIYIGDLKSLKDWVRQVTTKSSLPSYATVYVRPSQKQGLATKQSQGSQKISFSLKKRLALQVAHLLVTNFARAEKPITARQISAAIKIPLRLVQMTLLDLVASKIVSETDSGTGEASVFQPALDINLISIGYVIHALEHIGTDQLPIPHTSESDVITQSMKNFVSAIETHPDNRLLKDI